MIVRNGDQYRHSTDHVHLGNDSHNIVKHHINWRLRAMQAIEAKNASELHYSAAVSLSRKDVQRVKEKVIECLKENLAIIGASKEEVAYCYSFDFFEL